MAAVSSQPIVATGTAPAPITPAASDTIAAAQFGPNGCAMRVTTTSTASNVTVQDPGRTALGNPGAPSAVALSTSASRMIFIPTSAVDPVTNVATVAFSATAGVTYELWRI